MLSKKIFYGVKSADELLALTPADAADQFIGDNWSDDSPGDLPDSIEIYAYRLKEINESVIDQLFEDMLIALDERYRSTVEQGYDRLPARIKAKLYELKTAIREDFPVCDFVQVGEPVKVDLGPFILSLE